MNSNAPEMKFFYIFFSLSKRTSRSADNFRLMTTVHTQHIFMAERNNVCMKLTNHYSMGKNNKLGVSSGVM